MMALREGSERGKGRWGLDEALEVQGGLLLVPLNFVTLSLYSSPGLWK